MYSQFFGNYLLSRGAVTTEQLVESLSKIKDTRIKLGTLAIHKGLMVASEVDEVCLEQTRADKRFGEIAVEKGYLTDAQVEDLLKSQTPDYLLLGQTLVEMNVLTNSDLESLIIDYQNENEIYDMDMDLENKDKISSLISHFFKIADVPLTDYSLLYMELIFNNLIRFVGDDFTPLTPVPCTEYPVNFCVAQDMHSEHMNVITRLDMTEDTAIAFASRYAKMEFTDFDEYVQASMEDFINLHNGLYSVNLSNEYSVELTLNPPIVESSGAIQMDSTSFIIPVVYPFGNIQIIVSMKEN